jgi:hypothetical protein
VNTVLKSMELVNLVHIIFLFWFEELIFSDLLTYRFYGQCAGQKMELNRGSSQQQYI